MSNLRFTVPLGILIWALATGWILVAERPVHAHDAKEFSAGEPGNPKRPARTVLVTMRENDGKMLFFPDRLEVRRGEQVRFVLTNAGHLDHEFMIATAAENSKHAELMKKYPDMEHEDPNGRTVKPKRKAELVWRFTKVGDFEFACLIPGHYEAGMYGKIIVK
jgi:uncharacterized cupredoxin-like copper-binding protein